VRFEDDSPKIPFRPSWKLLLHLIDVAIIVGLFFLGAYVFRTAVGEKKLAAGERLRVQKREEAVKAQAQADSILGAERHRLDGALGDSASWADELARRRAGLEGAVAEQQRVNQGLYPLTDQVFDLQYRATTALAEVRQDREDLTARRAEIADLHGKADEAERELSEATERNRASAEQLAAARTVRTYEPEGVFPDKSGLVVRQDISDTHVLTNVAFQHNVWSPGLTEVGVSLGLGLGSEDVASAKEFGLVLSRNLVHRRLDLDLGAGYSIFTSPEGIDQKGAYASATLRLSPFYRERIHFGLGARAGQDEVTPFISVGVGRK
jgi:hypothetical protein